MSLQTKLTALAQAVGADIKALNAKVATTESYIQTTGGASLTGNGVLPVGAITQASNPAPFSRNADGTLTCLQDGVYQFNAVINCSSGLAAGTNIQYQINVNGGAVGYTTNAPVWPHTTLPWLGKVLAGQVVSVYVVGIGTSSQQCSMVSFSAARAQVGPPGPKGDLGGVLGANSFRQLAASAPAATSNWRTILVSATNEMDPAGAFTRNADGSVTIRDSGWYSVSATFRVVTVAALCTFALTDALNAPGNPFVTDTKALSPNYSNAIGADNYFAAGTKIYPNVWTDVSTQVELTYFVVSRLGGTKGDKGDVGGNTTVALDPWHTVGGAGENAPYGAAWGPANSIGQNLFFRKDPFGRVKVRGVALSKTAFSWGSVIFTLPPSHRPTTTPQDFEAISTEPDGTNNSVVQMRANIDGTVAIVAQVGQKINGGGWITGGVGTFLRLDGWEFDTDSVTQYMVGPQGPKGDPGGVNVVTTLDWNTALAPNFYKSTNDPFLKTANSPGDTLNPPRTAGIVTAHDNGALTQRVWDLEYQVGYTRYRATDGTWSAWVPEITKPGVYVGQTVGGPTPQDGDERYVQNAAMKAKGVMWKFRYNKNSASAYKWEFVGGSALESFLGNEATSSTGYVDLTTVQNFIAPLSGEYRVEFGGQVYNGSTGYQYVGLFVDGVFQMEAVTFVTSANAQVPWWLAYPAIGIAADKDVRIKFHTGAGTSTFLSRFFSIKPVRVSM